MEKNDCMKKKKLNSIYTAKKIISRANTVDRKVGKPLPVTQETLSINIKKLWCTPKIKYQNSTSRLMKDSSQKGKKKRGNTNGQYL